MARTIPTSFITNLNKRSSIIICDEEENIYSELPESGFLFIDKNFYNVNEKKFKTHPILSRFKQFVINPKDLIRSLNEVAKICKQFVELGVKRNDSIIAIGGKRLIDVYGFAASVYKNGLDFYMVPSTLLAMTDTAIGGVYHLNASNFVKEDIKIQSHPLKVLICPSIAKTTSNEVFQSGLANMCKLGCLDNMPLLMKLSKAIHFNFDKRTIENDLLADMIDDALRTKINLYLADRSNPGIFGFGDNIAKLYASFCNPTSHYGEASTIGMELTLDIMQNYCKILGPLTEYQVYQLNCLLRAINPELDNQIEETKEKFINGLVNMESDKIALTYFTHLGGIPIILEVDKKTIIEAIKNHKHYTF